MLNGLLTPTSLASLTYFVPDSNCHHCRAKEQDRGCAVKENDHFSYRLAHPSSLF